MVIVHPASSISAPNGLPAECPRTTWRSGSATCATRVCGRSRRPGCGRMRTHTDRPAVAPSLETVGTGEHASERAQRARGPLQAAGARQGFSRSSCAAPVSRHPPPSRIRVRVVHLLASRGGSDSDTPHPQQAGDERIHGVQRSARPSDSPEHHVLPVRDLERNLDLGRLRSGGGAEETVQEHGRIFHRPHSPQQQAHAAGVRAARESIGEVWYS